jgi:hypothetical protein
MKEREESDLRIQIEMDEMERDRHQYDYTVDALRETGIHPLSIWPESNQNVARVIKGQIDYDSLPLDESNEFHKGMCFTEQQDIILRNRGGNPLCEALDMNPCLQEECELCNTDLGPPVCREFKIVFEK